jgi:hypothetical protein
MSKPYDPNWPFPQYDHKGKIIIPPKQPKKPAYPEDLEEALL